MSKRARFIVAFVGVIIYALIISEVAVLAGWNIFAVSFIGIILYEIPVLLWVEFGSLRPSKWTNGQSP